MSSRDTRRLSVKTDRHAKPWVSSKMHLIPWDEAFTSLATTGVSRET
jgi:hypothetical protein